MNAIKDVSFHPGEKVVHISKTHWVFIRDSKPAEYGPGYLEIVTIKKVPGTKEGFVALEEYPDFNGTTPTFRDRWFQRMPSDWEIERLIRISEIKSPRRVYWRLYIKARILNFLRHIINKL